MDDSDFVRKMPKIELHAHLNGSLKTKSIQELGEQLYGSNTPEFLKLIEELVHFERFDLVECFKKFHFMHALTSTKKGLKLATELAIRDFSEDNVIYLELRTTPKRNSEMSKQQYMECILSVIDHSNKINNIRVNLLPSIDRSKGVAEAEDTINVALQLRNKYTGVITGIDFSGNPNIGEFEQFIPVLQKARENNLKLALHCAEIDNHLEIDKMIKFGMDRCGHGTFLSDYQLNELGRKNTAIECCLTSNVKCGTVGSYDDHHFKHIFQNKLAPIVLSTDDCGVFDTTLSTEFELAKKCYKLTDGDLVQINLNAIEHAFIEDSGKRELQQRVKEYFRAGL